MKNEINEALKVLHDGGVILYPTDTVWGLGCDATNENAVAKIIDIKGRSADKSFIILLHSAQFLPYYVDNIPDVAYDLIEYAESPLTVIYSNAKKLAENVVNKDGSIGIRVVRHSFCEALLQRFRKPITSTSANLSGSATPLIFSEISSEILNAVDYVVPLEQNIQTIKKPSTIMKIDPSGRFEFIRR